MNLDDSQYVAVTSEHKKTLVVAGAGSGKTRVLIERIRHLIDNGTSPHDILAFTFTRKAAGEMKKRLVDIIGSNAHKVTMGTSHAIGAEMIRRYDSQKARCSIYGPIESELVLKDVAEEMGVYKKKAWKPSRKSIDNAFLQYAAQKIFPEKDDPAYNLFHAFQYRCSQNRALTYDDLLVVFWGLIPLLAQFLSWKHVLVDECQDLTPLQWDIINDIGLRFGASIFAVGDTDQSIYRFRGACPSYVIDHQLDFGATFLLETNYRSLPGIVSCGNDVIKHCTSRIEKKSVPFRKNNCGSSISVNPVENIDSKLVMMMIQELMENEGGIAVLSRTHILLQKISRSLTEKNIRHIYVGNTNSMLKDTPAITVHSFLRLCLNPLDNFSFMTIRKHLGISDLDYAQIRQEATKARVGHLTAWLQRPSTSPEVARFFSNNKKLPSALSEIERMNLPIFSGPVFDFAANWIDENKEGNLFTQEYLDYVAVFDMQDEIVEDEEAPQLILSTIHAAKGLEFPTVIMVGMNDGIFPGSRAIADADNMNDEIRLAYVGMTRAEDTLFLTSRPTITEDVKGHVMECPVSRFVRWAMEG